MYNVIHSFDAIGLSKRYLSKDKLFDDKNLGIPGDDLLVADHHVMVSVYTKNIFHWYKKQHKFFA